MVDLMVTHDLDFEFQPLPQPAAIYHDHVSLLDIEYVFEFALTYC